jgi:soluble lytic murein transglycosylase
MYKIVILLFTALSLLAQEVTLEWLKKQPTSYAKDFYIWRYLAKDITPQQAKQALSGVRRLNNKILYRYITKSDDSILKEYKSCLKEKTFNLLNKEDYCIEAGLSLYDATKISKKDLKEIINKVQKEYPEFAKKLQILDSSLPFKSLIESDTKTFFGVFNQVGSYYRQTYFNENFPKSVLYRLSLDQKNFATMIKLIVTNPQMEKAGKSLLGLDAKNFDFKTTFHLAINAIRYKKEKLALNYLLFAYKQAYFQMEKDNIAFWQYQLTKDQKYLHLLKQSWDVNLYTLYANTILQQPQQNIIYTIEQKNKKLTFDINNPFLWHKVLKDTKKMDEKKFEKYFNTFTDESTIGHLAFVKERFNRYRKSYFIAPYEQYLKNIDSDRKALIYAIARQESRFIPTSISTAYAMGVMQIMPFLSKALAKELKEPYDIDKQLEVKTNLRYANHHLDFLDKRLNNPLFIAYGYNGGIGFTKRALKKGLFKKGKFEPWLSMELIPYDETKKYGKKVLTNYFIYQNYLNPENKIFFNQLIDSIKNY